MNRTYLRYECADSFGTICSSGTSRESLDVCFLPGPSSSSQHVLLPAISSVGVWDLRAGQLKMNIAHREDSSFGTQRALNSGEATCLDVRGAADALSSTSSASSYVASGWTDGSVRIFNVAQSQVESPSLLVNSLLSTSSDSSSAPLDAPLVLTGHSGPITSLAFDQSTPASSRVASGGADGKIVVWDMLAESGLYKLIGHRGGITSLAFSTPGPACSVLISGSLDGFVKVWDLDLQCCVQTVVGHRSEVWCMAFAAVRDRVPTGEAGGEEEGRSKGGGLRLRLVSGASDERLRCWAVRCPLKDGDEPAARTASSDGEKASSDVKSSSLAAVSQAIVPSNSSSDVLQYLGSVSRQSGDRASVLKFHPNAGRTFGVSTHGGRTVEVYAYRSSEEASKKRNRRVRRRREKANKAEGAAATTGEKGAGGKKKGMLDDSSDDDDDKGNGDDDKGNGDDDKEEEGVDANCVKAQDEVAFCCVVRTNFKVKGFAFSPVLEKGGGSRLVVALASNAVEVHSVPRFKDGSPLSVASRLSTIEMHGHPSPVRAITISGDDAMAATVGKGSLKVWSVARRSCVGSLDLSTSKTSAAYGLCCSFLPGSVSHVVVGTKEGALLLLDVTSGDVLAAVEDAHGDAIWSLDVQLVTEEAGGRAVAVVVTGSADKTAKFWELEDDGGVLELVHTKTLKMTDDIVCVKFSYSPDPAKLLVFVSSLDSTVKVYFHDTLKFFLSLYGHKLPALAIDCSDDDILLASAGADKTIKIWGLDFGDCHRSLHGHTDSITALRFVRKTHNFFTAAKDKTVRYWNADKFEQILLLNGHVSELHTLGVSKSGGFVLSAGADRQVRVWERTRDMVFVEEEREKELEKAFDATNNEGRNSNNFKPGSKADAADGDKDGNDEDDETAGDGAVQSEEAVKKSVMSVAAGDRLLEAIELADAETRTILATTASNAARAVRGEKAIEVRSNPLLLAMEPFKYILWVLKSVKVADLEQALLVLPIMHVERLMHYLVALLRSSLSCELCAKVTIFLIKSHQRQIVANHTMAAPLRELRKLLREQLTNSRDTIGVNLAAFKVISKTALDKRNARAFENTVTAEDIWGNLGVGSAVAAALTSKGGGGAKKAKTK